MKLQKHRYRQFLTISYENTGAATVGVAGVRTPQKFGRVCSTPPTFWQLHMGVIIELCFIEIWGLLKHFTLILAYALYICNAFHYIRESSSIRWPTLILYCKILEESEWGMKRRFYVPLDTQWVISETFFTANLLVSSDEVVQQNLRQRRVGACEVRGIT